MSHENSLRVSVVIPAYNAAATIDETLTSVKMQTYRDLEIIVVDDGSTDCTCAIVEKHIREDKRIRLLSQANAGVASARNRGLADASGRYFAPVDADDLWMPEKIAMQLVRITDEPRVSLVYTWYAKIDGESRVRSISRSEIEGAALPHLCTQNLVGHASSPLMRTSDVIAAGGYDTSLRARSAQGSEDWSLYLKLAEMGEFAVVKSVLTGYRTTEGNMSSDFAQMIRSTRIVLSEFAQTHPSYREELRAGELYTTWYYLGRAVVASHYPAAFTTFLQICNTDRRFAMELLRKLRLQDVRGAFRISRFRLRKRPVCHPYFFSGEGPEMPSTARFIGNSPQTIDHVPARAE